MRISIYKLYHRNNHTRLISIFIAGFYVSDLETHLLLVFICLWSCFNFLQTNISPPCERKANFLIAPFNHKNGHLVYYRLLLNWQLFSSSSRYFLLHFTFERVLSKPWYRRRRLERMVSFCEKRMKQ